MNSCEFLCDFQEIISTWGGEIIAATISAIVAFYLAYKIPIIGNQVIVEHTAQWEKDEITPEFALNLKPLFKGDLKSLFYLNEFVIKNNGLSVIDDEITIILNLNKTSGIDFVKSDFVHFLVDDENDITKVETITHSAKTKDQFKISRGFLHPFNGRNRETITITVVSNTDLKLLFKGVGKKWRVKYIDRTHLKKQTKSEKIIRLMTTISLVALLISLALYLAYNLSPINLIVFLVILFFFSIGLLQLLFVDYN